MFIFISASAWTPLSYMFTKLSFYAVLGPETCIYAKKCPPFMRSRANKAYCLPIRGCVTVTFVNQFIIPRVLTFTAHSERRSVGDLKVQHFYANTKLTIQTWTLNFQFDVLIRYSRRCTDRLCVFIILETCLELHRALRPFTVCSYASKNAKHLCERMRKKQEGGIGCWPVNLSNFRWRRQGHPSNHHSC